MVTGGVGRSGGAKVYRQIHRMLGPRRYCSIRLLLVLSGLATQACVPVPTKPMPPVPDLSGIQTYPTRQLSDSPLAADSQVAQTPAVLRMGPLHYPREARTRGLQGWAVFDFIIGPDGRPEAGSLRLVAASDPVFAPAAERAITEAEFVPGRVWGVAVRVLVRLPVRFALR